MLIKIILSVLFVYVRSNRMKATYSSAVTTLLVVICLPLQSTCQRTGYLYYSSQDQAGGGPGLYVSGDVKFCELLSA